MAIDNLSQRISELSQRLEELQAKCVNNPEYAPEVLSDALDSLQASLEELSAADEELIQQNEELKHAQSTLQKSEEKFRLVADFTYDWETWIDPKGNYVYVSPSCERITGYYAEEFIENPSLSIDIIHPDDKEAFKQHQNVHFDEQTDSAQIDYRIITTKGEIRWISHICQPVFGRNGEWLGSRASNRDITERKQAEEALHANEKRLQAVLAGMTDAYYFYDREWRFVDINPRAVEYFGRPREVLLGRNVWELYPHTVGGKPWTEYHRAMAEGVPVHFETQSGVSPRFFEVHAYPEPEGLAVYLRDITERKRMEGALQEKQEELEVQAEELEAQNEELRINNDDLAETTRMLQESEARFRATFEQAAVGIEMLNLDGRFLRGNAMLSEILGYSQKELQYLNFADITYSDDLVRELPLLEDLLARRIGHYTIEKRYMRKDGQGVWVRVTSSLADVSEPYRISIIEDITERKQVEDALQEAKDHLEMRVKERTSELEQANVRLQDEIAERKKVEEALQAAGAYNRSLIEASLDPLVTIGPDGKITDVNAATEVVTGYGLGDLIGTDFSDYFTEPDKARAGYQQVFEKGFVRDYALEIRHYDGHITPVLYNASVYRKDAGEIIGVFAAARDVTERKRVEVELDKYRKHLEELVRDRTHELEVANSKLQAEIIERKQAEEAARESRSKLEAALASMTDAVFISDAEGRFIDFNDAFATFHRFKNKNECLKTLAEYPDILDVFTADGKPAPLDGWAVPRALRGETVTNAEYILRRKDTGETWVGSYSFGPIRDKNGTIIGSVVAVRDVTELKRAEEELHKSKDELELRVKERTVELSDAKENLEVINEELQVEISEHEKTEKELLKAKEAAEAAVEAKAAFLANMSHELRTPLNAVIGFSSLLLEDNLTQDQKEDIERIRTGGEALLAIISDILEFSRAEKEKVKLELQPLSLKRSIEESMDMVAAQANKKGLNLAYTINYGTPDTIIGDPGRLRQVLVNLLSNAVKFTDVGDISVSVSSKTLEGNKRQITFSVKDTGIGMPQDKMDRLFLPFTQLEYVISRKRDGAGLGLAISKKLVELMGGEIWAESDEGKGSTFRFTIQAETIPGKQLDLDEKDKATAYENLSAQKPLSILVAEDNPSNQKVLVDMLKRLGYRPDAVADGREVLQALQIRPYDLVFMDIQMPEMDGLTATREIRKLWPENGPKVVAITAFAMDGDREKCLEAGADDYIAKHVKVDDLAMLLRNITPPPRIKFKR